MTLRACPFCGGTNLKVEKDPACVERYQWRVLCFGCMTVGPMMPSIESAQETWNKREPDWEWKWGTLVETVSARTDQAKEKP